MQERSSKHEIRGLTDTEIATVAGGEGPVLMTSLIMRNDRLLAAIERLKSELRERVPRL